MPSEEKFSTRPSRRTAWGGEIYRNIESGDFDERFLKTKSEFLHTTKALTRFTILSSIYDKKLIFSG